MSNNGNITVPNLNADFEKAANPVPPEQKTEQGQTEQGGGIVTKAELDERTKRDEELEAKLKTPKLIETLEIDGSIKKEVDETEFDKNKKEFEENRKRKEYLEGRLYQRNLTREFNRNR